MDNINDFEIKNGKLIKYLGMGGDIVIPNGVESLTSRGILIIPVFQFLIA